MTEVRRGDGKRAQEKQRADARRQVLDELIARIDVVLAES